MQQLSVQMVSLLLQNMYMVLLSILMRMQRNLQKFLITRTGIISPLYFRWTILQIRQSTQRRSFLQLRMYLAHIQHPMLDLLLEDVRMQRMEQVSSMEPYYIRENPSLYILKLRHLQRLMDIILQVLIQMGRQFRPMVVESVRFQRLFIMQFLEQS